MKFSTQVESMRAEVAHCIHSSRQSHGGNEPLYGPPSNAAEDSRSLPQARDWRVYLHATKSARFWSAAVLCRFHRARMNFICVVHEMAFALAILSALSVLTFLSGCSQKEAEKNEAASAPEKKEESRVSHGTNGETIIKLDAETQKLMGLQTATLSAAQLDSEIKAYGRVLDPAPLAALVADLISATAASAASQAELDRLKTLAAQNNASARALESAEAAAARDKAQAEAARLKLMGSWGTAVAGRDDLKDFARLLGSLEGALIQLNVSSDQLVTRNPSVAKIVTLAETKPVEAAFLGRAPSVDPQVQGQGFLFLVSPNPSRLSPGGAVTGFIDVTGEKQSGVALPRNAIVRFNGATWVYLQMGEDTFERTEVGLVRPLLDGWFVREGLKPDAKIVITGAEQLLSEELKGGGME